MLEHLPSVPVQKTFVHTHQSELYPHTPLKLKKEKDISLNLDIRHNHFALPNGCNLPKR